MFVYAGKWMDMNSVLVPPGGIDIARLVE
jgi:hypothetical protein